MLAPIEMYFPKSTLVLVATVYLSEPELGNIPFAPWFDKDTRRL